jgi:hypothetical protein
LLGGSFDQSLPQLLSLIVPIVILIVGYSLTAAIAPWPLKDWLRFSGKVFKALALRVLAGFGKAIQWIVS